MSKKILLIESDAPFAEELSTELEARGLEVRTTGDGREGYDLAKEWGPDAIVLCVELPGMSGYVICQKLKKDEALKSIPLVITSAEATPETFEKHRTLKVRAEDYLLKPFTATTLLASIGAFIELPEPGEPEPLPEPGEPTGEPEEELVALEEEAGIEALGGEPLGGPDLPALDLGSLPDDGPAGTPAPGLEDDLKLLDEAFEGMAHHAAGESPVAADEVDAAASSLPEADDAAARAALGRLDLGADDALAALGAESPHEPPAHDLERDLLGGLGPDLGLGEIQAEEEPLPPSRKTIRAPAADVLRSAGIKMVGEKPAPAEGVDTARHERELSRKDARIDDLEGRSRELEERLSHAERRAEDAERHASEAASRTAALEAQAAGSKSRLDSALAQSKRLEADLKAARDELARARRRTEEAEQAAEEERRRADDAEARLGAAGDSQEKIEALEREVDELKTELVVARGEVEGARGEVEKRTIELKRRLQDLEAQAAKNEERVVKAYLKIKNDEKLREKTRKALAVASQLLEEGASPEAAPEKPRSAAAALGRDQ